MSTNKYQPFALQCVQQQRFLRRGEQQLALGQVAQRGCYLRKLMGLVTDMLT
jgi:hypothetical protein